MARRGSLELDDDRLKAVFSYPRFIETHYEAVLGDLSSLGVREVLQYGEVELGEVKVVGKGCTGVVCLGVMQCKAVALKILRSDSGKGTLEVEGENLRFANSFGVGPELFGFRRNVVAMELIRGVPLIKWLEGGPASSVVRKILSVILLQCRILDAKGLDHGELSDSKKHIMIEGTDKARIIDFESASRSRKCRNLTSVASYLFLGGAVSDLLRAHMGWERDAIVEAMRNYKRDPSESAFVDLMTHLKLY